MRIVYIYNSLSKRGGTEHILTQKMNYLSEVYGHDVFVVTNEQNNEGCAFPLSHTVTHIDLDVQLWKKYLYPLPIRFIVEHHLIKIYRKKILDTLHQIKPDILVCCHTFLPDLICSLPIKAKKIIEAHNPRNIFPFERGRLSYSIENRQWKKRLNKAEKSCDVVVSLTTGDALSWKLASRVEVIPDMVEPYALHKYPSDSKKVVSLGRFVPQKDFSLLIDAWKGVCSKHPDWILEIYGEGELRENLQKKIMDSHLSECVHLLPFTREVERVISESSFLVCSSRFEGFGMTLVEAMMVGRPCVSFNCPFGPEDIIQDGKNGILVSNGNIKELSDKICFMIENPLVRLNMASNASASSVNYHPQNIMPKWKALFESV